MEALTGPAAAALSLWKQARRREEAKDVGGVEERSRPGDGLRGGVGGF